MPDNLPSKLMNNGHSSCSGHINTASCISTFFLRENILLTTSRRSKCTSQVTVPGVQLIEPEWVLGRYWNDLILSSDQLGWGHWEVKSNEGKGLMWKFMVSQGWCQYKGMSKSFSSYRIHRETELSQTLGKLE